MANPKEQISRKGVVRLLYGEDSFRVRERLKFYLDAFKRQYDSQGLGVEHFFVPSFDVETLHCSLNSPPLFTPKRLFVIYDFSKLKLDENKEKIISKDVENLQNNSIIFLEEIDEKTFKNSSFYKKIKLDSAEYFPQLKGVYLEKEVQRRFEREGCKIEPSALKKFIMFVGNDFWKINSEMQKMIAFLNYSKRKTVILKDIETVAISNFIDNSFALIDFLNQKKREDTIKELQNLKYSGVNPETIFYQIAFNFRQLLELKFLTEKEKVNLNILSKILDIHPYRLQKLYEAVENFSLDELKKIHNLILKTDYMVKTGALKVDIALDLLVMSLCL